MSTSNTKLIHKKMRITILGDPGTGKSTLMNKYINFNISYLTSISQKSIIIKESKRLNYP
jgi:GTPase Era involved in 16S rRNA processing